MALALPVLIFGVLLICVLVLVSLRAPGASTSAERTAAQRLKRARWCALAVAVVGFIMAAVYGGDLGRGFVIAPGVAGVLALACLAVAERSVPTEASPQRMVRLERRRPMSWVRPITWGAGGANLVLATAILAIGWATASADDSGRSGRAVEWVTTGGSQRNSPWPGFFYDIPAMVAVVSTIVAFVVALRAVVARAQLNADAHAQLSDEQMRRRSADIVQGVLLVALGLTLGELSVMLLGGTATIEPGAPGWVNIAHWLGMGGTVVGGVTALTGVIVGAKR